MMFYCVNCNLHSDVTIVCSSSYRSMAFCCSTVLPFDKKNILFQFDTFQVYMGELRNKCVRSIPSGMNFSDSDWMMWVNQIYFCFCYVKILPLNDIKLMILFSKSGGSMIQIIGLPMTMVFQCYAVIWRVHDIVPKVNIKLILIITGWQEWYYTNWV